MRCTKAVIYSENLISNVNEIKKNLKPGVKLCCAVKANAYGNDALNSARIFERLGAEYLAIATSDEGRELRENGIRTKLLLLSPADYSEFEDIVENGITPLVFEKTCIEKLDEEAGKYEKISPCFLAVDTGMGRIGCCPEEAGNLAKEIAGKKNLSLEGMITHFAVSDSTSEENILYTKNQFRRFKDAVKLVKDQGINPGICTCSASAAGIAFPEMQLDMIRPGLILYGYYPDQVTKDYLKKKGTELYLKPVMQFETKVSSIRTLKKGESVSYGRTWKADEDTKIAVLPVGYADGLLRRYSPGLEVSINGKAYPVVGRICMDQCMVDLGKNGGNVKPWDKAIIFGPKDKGAVFDADDLARMTGTISYEVMTTVSYRVKRTIVSP